MVCATVGTSEGIFWITVPFRRIDLSKARRVRDKATRGNCRGGYGKPDLLGGSRSPFSSDTGHGPQELIGRLLVFHRLGRWLGILVPEGRH
ncbi:hypothetical protein SBA4_20041 [Candidatus Sulfopaludibacter sp. SbA4]|nr:hypothetical protein SBA4_20041 [Candidatus Sulfopaludibacter sp. SbA4]